jgi:dimeric dUTPase (all-alpha-NTP-PPase superfamily)
MIKLLENSSPRWYSPFLSGIRWNRTIIMKQALTNMLEMQHRMNTRVHEQWVEQGFEWYRAAWIECGELMDHQGYKWWKQQLTDLPQVQLEIVDIWHFGMSAILTEEVTIEASAARIEQELDGYSPQSLSVLEATEALALHALGQKSFSPRCFWDLMAAAEMDFEHLYRSYVGKNVLNFFRQDNGYKDGSYVKEWQGREDNEHLVELAEQLDSTSTAFADDLYTALDLRYKECCT